MVQGRLIRTAFLLAACFALSGLPLPEHPPGTVVRSLLDDLAPGEPERTPQTSGLWSFLSDLISSKESSERCSSASLKTLSAAEADFRANDRDWCHVNDFWTESVGLYALSTDIDGAIRLIEISVASADAEENP